LARPDAKVTIFGRPVTPSCSFVGVQWTPDMPNFDVPA